MTHAAAASVALPEPSPPEGALTTSDDSHRDAEGARAAVRWGDAAALRARALGGLEVLLVDGCEADARQAAQWLQAKGFLVQHARSLGEARGLLARQAIDLIVVDPTASDAGEDYLSALAGSGLPILAMSGQAEIVDRVHALESGADAFVPKSAHPLEIVAQVRALARRGRSIPQSARAQSVDAPYHYTAGRRQFSGPTGSVRLAPADHEVLTFLMERAGKPCSRESLAQAIGLDQACVQSRLVDARIRRLRVRLESCGVSADLVQTLRLDGYCLCATVTPEGPDRWRIVLL